MKKKSQNLQFWLLTFWGGYSSSPHHLSSWANKTPGRVVPLSHPLRQLQMSSVSLESLPSFYIRELTLVSAGHCASVWCAFSTVLQRCLLSTFTIHSQTVASKRSEVQLPPLCLHVLIYLTIHQNLSELHCHIWRLSQPMSPGYKQADIVKMSSLKRLLFFLFFLCVPLLGMKFSTPITPSTSITSRRSKGSGLDQMKMWRTKSRPGKRIPEAMHSMTRRRASPGPSGRLQVAMAFSQISSRGCKAQTEIAESQRHNTES